MNPWIVNLLRSAGSGGGSAPPPTGRTFFVPLKSSLVLSEGTGSPTFTRATKAWRLNERGYLRDVPSGCAVLEGARLVRNLCVTKSEDFTNAVWTKTALTAPSANLLVCANSTTAQNVLNGSTPWESTSVGDVLYFRYRVQYVDIRYVAITPHSASFGTGIFCNFDLVGKTTSATGCTGYITEISPNVFDIAIRATATLASVGATATLDLANSLASPRKDNFIGDGVKSIGVLRYSANYVTSYDASYVPEYVSVGVASAPFFGAGADGAKYYETDWQGAPIPAANLLGFRREASATNNLLYNRTLDGRFATSSYFTSHKAWIPTTTGSELVTNGTFASDVSGWTAENSVVTWSAGKMRVVTVGANGWVKQILSLTVGKTYLITASSSVIAGGVTNASIRIHPDTSSASIPVKMQLSVTGTDTYALIFTATAASQLLLAQNESNSTIEYDDISVKEATMSVRPTATGLDGIANAATTLTATAADAIILQPITLASAARCASAYVKRRTGTGTISFTQDGGGSWTDITSQINSSTWSRVQITSTLANPSVGFKLGTSGDAIDVDCVQNEAGSVATSPIVTTTATVTRNAESLTYQTAGNIDFSVGTIYCEVQSEPTSSNRNAVAPGNSSCNASNSSSTSWRAYDGTTVVEKIGLSDIRTGKRKRVNSWGPENTKVTGDGLPPASGAFDGLFGDGAILYIAQNFQGYIGPVAIYNYQMTDAELQAITA